MKNKKEKLSSNQTLESIIVRLDRIEVTMATKDDLKGFATKDDLKNYATKDDFARLTTVILKNSDDIQELKKEIQNTSTKEDIRMIMNILDSMTKQFSLFDQEERVQSFQLVEVKHQVDNHEKRIGLLESHFSR